ncbi:hypothetical protein WMY93_028145 [Mugilogobius chulae]|uniref:RING-type E3 ubiquitin transferase n=1 Tax=Mugilogobius chulae TaxID=88201 RepID=A0AAW0MTS0_9GOBI
MSRQNSPSFFPLIHNSCRRKEEEGQHSTPQQIQSGASRSKTGQQSRDQTRTMAPVSDVEQEAAGSRDLSREDCLCPICLEIFIEPVTLPCTHTFCKVCFLESVDKATLCCPMCRKRVSTWARQHSRTNTLVNEPLWARIQRAFPQCCDRRLQGHDTEYTEKRRKKRERRERERKRERERAQRGRERERDREREEERREKRERREERNSASQLDQSHVSEATPVKKKPVGQIDRFLCPLSRSPAHSSQANKVREHLGPSEPAHRTSAVGLLRPTNRPITRGGDGHERGPIGARRQACGGRTKRKSGEVCSEEDDDAPGKRSCQSSGLMGVAMAEWEAELQRRRRQEEEDLRLALQLQQELDRQQRQTDRSKGSEDAYLLRTPGPRKQTRNSASASAAASNQSVRRKQPPAATVTLSSLRSSPQTSPDSTPATTSAFTATSAFSTPLFSPKPSRPSSNTVQISSKPSSTAPKTCQKSPPQTPKPNRQTTLTDLFNLHS